jgi:hypothetical protein
MSGRFAGYRRRGHAARPYNAVQRPAPERSGGQDYAGPGLRTKSRERPQETISKRKLRQEAAVHWILSIWILLCGLSRPLSDSARRGRPGDRRLAPTDLRLRQMTDSTAGGGILIADADGVEEPCVTDLRGVLRELDVHPGDDVAERTTLERPACSLH